MIEYFPVVNDEGQTIGKATRQECHSGSFLLHPVVHLHVFNSKNELYLQKRLSTKDIQPDKWDTAVGGHIDYGEETLTALIRETMEELGIKNFTAEFITRYKFVSEQEAELVHVYRTLYDGAITPNPDEISEGKFWTLSDIEANIGRQLFTPNFEQEYIRIFKSH